MKSVAELNQKLESQKRHVAKEVRQNLERLDRKLKEDSYTFTNKGLKKLRDSKEFQEVANTPRKTTAEGKGFEHNKQKKTPEIPVQTDTQSLVNVEAQIPSKPKSQAFSFLASKDSTKEKSNNKKPEKAKVPLKQFVSPSVNKNSAERKSSDKKPQSDKKENAVQSQENKKEEGLLSLLKRFVKKILEKLLGEDEKNVKMLMTQKELLKGVHQVMMDSSKALVKLLL